MFNNSIDSKPLFKKTDGKEIRDLTQSMLDLKKNTYVNYQAYKVPKEYAMRPDLISKAVYNNTLYAEVILKFNGISNPFSINTGDVILIPDLEDAQERIKIPEATLKEDNAEKIRNAYKYIDPLKIPQISDTLKKYEERNYVDAEPDSLPPNFADPNTPQIRFSRGRVYFGEGAETCVKNGMSAGEYISNVISNSRNNTNNS